MKPIKHLCLILFSAILFNYALFAQTQNGLRIVIMPFISNGIDNTTITSSQTILQREISKLGMNEVFIGSIPEKGTIDPTCTELDCAVIYGEKLNANRVVTCNLLVLGKKIIIQYTLVDVKFKKILVFDSITSLSIEELDVIMKRIAAGVINIETTNQTAKVGSIIENENKPLLLRGGGGFYGFSFGYLFPQDGFGNNDRSFTMDFKAGYEIDKYEYGIQLLARNGFGTNIYGSYLFSPYDVCPYFGGGLGFHWVSYSEPYENSYGYNSYPQPNNKKGDGFELLLNTGVRLFNTYNFRLTVNLSYSITFNDYRSNSLALTIGFLR
jgi:hypothetical protein